MLSVIFHVVCINNFTVTRQGALYNAHFVRDGNEIFHFARSENNRKSVSVPSKGDLFLNESSMPLYC